MTEYWKILILAVVQGIAEFLPISSSGHLQVLGSWFGFDGEENLTLNVVLHAGTLLAILIFYFQKLLSLLLEAIFRRQFRVILLVIAGTIPTAIIGLIIKKTGLDEMLFGSIWVPVGGFALTATLLWVAFRRNSGRRRRTALELRELSFPRAVWIGIVQGIAVTPGISRSGSTISAGVKCGLKNTDAAEFSFLLAIPAIAGAMFLEVLKMSREAALPGQGAIPVGALLLGFFAAAGVGYLALRWLIALLRGGKLIYFAYYLYAAAVLVAAVTLIRG